MNVWILKAQLISNKYLKFFLSCKISNVSTCRDGVSLKLLCKALCNLSCALSKGFLENYNRINKFLVRIAYFSIGTAA